MIDRHQLATACRENDAYADQGRPINEALTHLGFKDDDATYVAMQRALRMYGVMMGTDASRLTLADMHQLPPRDRIILSAMATCWIDGVAAASRALDTEGR